MLRNLFLFKKQLCIHDVAASEFGHSATNLLGMENLI